jgi:hypothetical protein
MFFYREQVILCNGKTGTKQKKVIKNYFMNYFNMTQFVNEFFPKNVRNAVIELLKTIMVD